MEEIRLQKYISDCGVMSRRAAEAEIEKGNVTVNGRKATIGQKIRAGKDDIRISGVPVEGGARKLYVALYKPRGYVTTMKDEKGRKCIPELVSDIDDRIYPCGRLDMDSEGLVLLTNDGSVADKLMHPKAHIKKIYRVTVRGELSEEKLDTLCKPMIIDGYKTLPAQVTLIAENESSYTLKFVLSEGRNRQIRKMCEQTDLAVTKLKRISIGNISLGDLKVGKWRYLSKGEIDYLKKL